MTPAEVHQAIARLRREMPRNKLAMDLCDAAEKLLSAAAPKKASDAVPFNKKAYQKKYMREYRAKAKAQK